MMSRQRNRIMSTLAALLMALLVVPAETRASNQRSDPNGKPAGAVMPLKVYILAGQSNMQGRCMFRTVEYMKMDRQTVPMLEKIAHQDGTPRVIENVWISSLGSAREEKSGQLTAGYGFSRGNTDIRIGPELTFGIYMQQYVKQPILLIKTAWGGKSLCIDFRPPSAGPYRVGEQATERLDKRGDDVAKIEAKRRELSGHYYRRMIDHVKKVLADIKQVYPGYDPRQGYEVAGFVWFQGCQDFGDTTTYPDAGKPGGYDEYSRLLACLIRDVRRELNAPKMRVVIGVMGINGELDTQRARQIQPKFIPWLREFRKAMAAPAKLPEFQGNVAAVMTEQFWDPKLEQLQVKWGQVKAKAQELNISKIRNRTQREAALDKIINKVYTPEQLKMMKVGTSNAAYHYMGSAKIMARIGKAFADAMAGLSPSKSTAVGGETPPKEKRTTAEAVRDNPAPFPGNQSLFEGKFDMYSDGGNKIVVPRKVAAGKPWVWRARFWRHEPQFDLAMLNKGYHVVYCNVAALLGNPTAVERWNKYYQYLVEKHGFAKKAVLEGMSRGGLIIYNWAIANPDKVAAIYGDAPVMDLKSWPGFDSRLLHRAYSFKNEQQFAAWKGNPVDNLKPLADAGIPIIHVVGDKDTTVPVSENTAIAEQRYKAMGGIFQVIHKKDCGHHPHSLKDPTPIVSFIEKYVEKDKR